MQIETREVLRNLALVICCLVVFFVTCASAQRYEALHSFTGGSDGARPVGRLDFDSQGNIYGTAAEGGDINCSTDGCGVVFELSPSSDGSWTETVLHSFDLQDGKWPIAGVVFGPGNNLYGTASGGGDHDQGVVYSLSSNLDGTWTEHVLHNFTGGWDGANPFAAVTFDTAGDLYGTTMESGPGKAHGVVFSIVKNLFVVLTGFNGKDGDEPYAGRLVFGANGEIYGTTIYGGAYGLGTVYALIPEDGKSHWQKKILYSFGPQGPNPNKGAGTYPSSGVVLGSDGNLYGEAEHGGGLADKGAIFRLTHNPDGSWTPITLYAFHGPDGADPVGGLTFDNAGNLYGTTYIGGTYNYGTVFRFVPLTGELTVLHSFQQQTGAYPVGGITLDAAGNLFGTTAYGGPTFNGVAFEITP